MPFAVGLLDPADVRRVLESLREVLAERAELVARLRRLTPAWGELQSVLNHLNRSSSLDAPDRHRFGALRMRPGRGPACDRERPRPALRQRGLVLAVRHYGAVRRRTWPTDFAGGAARSGTFSSAIISWSCRPDARVASTVLALRARAVHRERVFGPLTGGGEEGSVGIPKGTLILWSAHRGPQCRCLAGPLALRSRSFRRFGRRPTSARRDDLGAVRSGARNCIGFALAQMELTLIVARLAQRLDLSPVSTSRPSRRTSRRLPAWSSTARREEHRCGSTRGERPTRRRARERHPDDP